MEGKKRRGNAFVSLTLLAVLVSGLAIVGRMLMTAASGDTVSLHEQITMTLIGLTSAVILVVGRFSPYVPGHWRRQALQKMFPEAVVLNARMNRTLATVFRQLEPDALATTANPLITFGVVATAQGMTLWSGLHHPQPFRALPWNAVGTITVGSRTIRGIPLAGLQIERLSGEPPIPFLVGSEHFFGIFPARERYLTNRAQHLETLRRSLRSD